MAQASSVETKEHLDSIMEAMRADHQHQWDAKCVDTLIGETDLETVESVMLAFRDNIKQALASVQGQSKTNVDYENVSRLAHRLKSSSKMLGFNDLWSVCSSVEEQYGVQKTIKASDIDAWLEKSKSVMSLINNHLC